MLGFILWFSLSLGLQEAYTEQYVHAPVFVEISVHAENDWLELYGIYKNEMVKADLIYFSPRQDTYTVGVRLGNDNISLNIEHQCSHAVNPFNENRKPFDTGYNKVWIEVNSK